MEFNDGIIDIVVDAVAGALKDGAEDIAEQSKREVPKKSGALQESCSVDASNKMDVTLKYDAPYAVVVHEDLSRGHSVGKAKYLEDPFNAKADEIINRAAQEIKRVIE